MPKVSVIIPSYNHEKFVAEAIQSVLNQTYPDFEIVITDDGSADNTVNIIKQFTDPRIRLFCFPKNRGAAVAANNCLRESRGELIAMLSSDDVFAVDKLAKQVNFLQEHAEVGAVFSYAQIIDEYGDDFAQENHFYKQIFIQNNRNRFEWLNHFFFKGNCLCHPSALIRKKCYEDVGKYDERFAQLPDFDFWIRLCMKYEIYIMPEELIKFRIRDNEANASGNKPEARIRHEIEQKQILHNYFSPEIRRDFSEIFPEAGLEINNEDDAESIDLQIAILAIKAGTPTHQCLGIDKLYDLLNSKNNYNEKLKIKSDFEVTNLIKITGQYDIFNNVSKEKLYLQIGQMQSELEYLHSQLQLTQAELEDSQVIIQEKQTALERSHAQIQVIQAKLEYSPIQLRQTEAELEEVQSELQQTQVELGLSQTKVKKIKAELECKPIKLQKAEVKLDNLQCQLQQKTCELQQAEAELKSLHCQLQESQAELGRSQITIAAIETSKFWQLRILWFKFRHRILRLADDNVPLQTGLLSLGKKLWTVLKIKGIRYTFAKLPQTSEQKLHNLTSPVEFLPEIPRSNDISYQKWLNKNYPTQAILRKMAEMLEILPYKPVFSLIMPVFNTPERFLREAIESVLNQIYPYWELCIADDASTEPYIKVILEEYIAKDSRIKVVFRTENGHISQASNSALEIASGEFITLFDHDDLLTPDALYEVAFLLNKHPKADMIYSDEDKIDDNNILQHPFFKPDWCPDTFLSRMYTCHLGTYRREVVNAIGGFRAGYEGSQDYDLVLRLTEKTNNIFHIPKILYHWRIHPQSAAAVADVKPYAILAAEKALADALHRRGENGEVKQAANLVGHHIIRYKISDYKLVSIIIPTKDLAHLLDKCLTSIFAHSIYPNYEVIVIDNGSKEKNTADVIAKWTDKEPSRFKCYPFDIPFNYSKINNYAVNQVNGDYILFLNNDIEVITSDWIDAMVEQAQRPTIGAVGALLLYPDNTIQHAGVVMGIGGVANHSHKHFPYNSPGYFGQILTVNNYTSVTAACLMCRREVFQAVGGFEEELAVAFNDVDLCLKIVEKGYKNIYLPHVMLYHHESKSRGYEDTPAKLARFTQEIEYMQKKWKKFIEYDPCYSIHLTSKHEDYSIKT